MTTGTIRSLRDRGFGFIAPDSGNEHNELFFHGSAVIGTTFDELREGQQVSFDVEPDPRDSSRSRAVRVQLSTGSNEA